MTSSRIFQDVRLGAGGCVVVGRMKPGARRRAGLAALVLLAAAGPAGTQDVIATRWIGNGGVWTGRRR